ncbi:MAG: GNAT family N-acetyltransferase [Fibrobacteres bacterium]|nr:GNAT family N-acetyltransferase [Fibrobacterota bacterium]
MKLIQKADPREIESIELGKDKYIDYLYGCMRINNPKGQKFETEREVEIVFRSQKKIKITVPAEMKVDLPDNTKVVNTDMFSLEAIGNNRDSMHLLTMRAGWNQNERDINRIIDFDVNGNFAAKLKGKGFDIPVGTATVAPLGKNNTWIGMILVHPELRRHGIANYMMQAGVKYAIDNGKIINGLDATPMGNTVYGAVGYVDSYRIWRSVFPLAQFAGEKFDTNRVKVMTAAELPEVIRYDASCFIEREEIMQKLFADGEGKCFVYRGDNGDIQGFCLTRPGRIRSFVGPFTADTDAIAKDLLVAASQSLHKGGAQDAFIDTPEAKFADPGVYDKSVFDQVKKPTGHKLIKEINCVRDFTRMYQIADYKKADFLVKDFIEKEKLDKNSKRVKEFQETMYKSVMNYTESLAYMEYERNVLQNKFWGITGPEKG